MFLNIVFLVLGLVFILVGANMLTDGASAIAKRWGVPDLVIGLTVVAFGTSAPELVISVVSAINGNAGIAIGNAVGSNIFNVLMIIGITAIVLPMPITKGSMTKDIPLVVLSALALLVIGNGDILDGDTTRILSRVDGILLIFFFCIFMRYTFSQAKATTEDPTPASATSESTPEPKSMKLWKASLWVLLGLAGLIIGGDRFVAGASAIASALGVSDAVIGLTIVAAGTSLPELATSITAALKGQSGIAIGNVIGSNIFNIFLVLGVAGTIRPLPFGNIGNLDLLTLTGACVLFWIFGWVFKKRTITRLEGVIMAACYVAYITVLVLQATNQSV